MSTHRKVARSAGVIGSLTGVSRILGFIRDMVIAAAFGTGVSAEAFVVAFKIPNLLRDLVGEGATNAAFVPVLTESREKRPAEFWPLVSTLFFSMSGVLLLLAALGMLFTPGIVGLLAPGFLSSADSDKFPLTVTLTRAMFPYVFLIGLSALAMGVLNSLKEFTSSALGPILLNISLILAGVFFEKRYGPMALVIGVLAGGVMQLACQIPPLVKSGFRLTRPSVSHASAAKIGKLLLPRALGSALYQINVFVDSILASFETIIGPGGQSALYYSNRLFQLPLAVFGVALSQALLPTLSTQAVRGDLKEMKATILFAFRTLMLLVLPASVGLLVLARPIVRIIFEHGRFDAYSTSITSRALFFYAFGLLSCCFIKVLVNAFYAMQDTRTPVKTMLLSVSLNVALSVTLMRFLGIGGLTLASSISATVNMALLYAALRRKIGPLSGGTALASFLRFLGMSLLMGLFAWGWNRWMLEPRLGDPRLSQSLWLGLGIGASVGLYLGLLWLFRVEEARKLFSWRG
ncbi:MAG TPA: murein biosynthesis integral membrane protein MurJ [Candidatus Eisenbacteria bacterium]|nr:murein biosynthesis integral membrane protein MurJ [Candidatus Eisenbacteria bacterium]